MWWCRTIWEPRGYKTASVIRHQCTVYTLRARWARGGVNWWMERAREGGRERGREGGREWVSEGVSEGGREWGSEGREGGREGWREGEGGREREGEGGREREGERWREERNEGWRRKAIHVRLCKHNLESGRKHQGQTQKGKWESGECDHATARHWCRRRRKLGCHQSALCLRALPCRDTCCMGSTDTRQYTTTYMMRCAHSNTQLHSVDEAAQLIEESAKPCREASNCTTHWLTDSP